MLPFGTTDSPLWNAAGTLGFALPKHSHLNASLGAFVTNPISWGLRTPARGNRLIEFPGGVLLHTGLPNPGFQKVRKEFAKRWARAQIPVLVHIIAEAPETLSRMVRLLEETEGIAGVELGLPPEADAGYVTDLIHAARGELPLILNQAFDGNLPSPLPDAISLAPSRGSLPGNERGVFVQGRLYGPGVFPQVLHAVRKWKDVGVPLIAGGGVYHPDQAEALLTAGASIVQLDLRLWRDPWPDEAWKSWLANVPSKSSSAHR